MIGWILKPQRQRRRLSIGKSTVRESQSEFKFELQSQADTPRQSNPYASLAHKTAAVGQGRHLHCT